MKILYVEWMDAAASSSWDKFDNNGIHFCRSIGFLIKETKLDITLAAAVSGDEANATISIPKVWIKKKRIIKLKL